MQKVQVEVKTCDSETDSSTSSSTSSNSLNDNKVTDAAIHHLSSSDKTYENNSIQPPKQTEIGSQKSESSHENRHDQIRDIMCKQCDFNARGRLLENMKNHVKNTHN